MLIGGCLIVRNFLFIILGFLAYSIKHLEGIVVEIYIHLGHCGYDVYFHFAVTEFKGRGFLVAKAFRFLLVA